MGRVAQPAPTRPTHAIATACHGSFNMDVIIVGRAFARNREDPRPGVQAFVSVVQMTIRFLTRGDGVGLHAHVVRAANHEARAGRNTVAVPPTIRTQPSSIADVIDSSRNSTPQSIANAGIR
jgi:hypothetical protein